jgi:hypothetical protein
LKEGLGVIGGSGMPAMACRKQHANHNPAEEKLQRGADIVVVPRGAMWPTSDEHAKQHSRQKDNGHDSACGLTARLPPWRVEDTDRCGTKCGSSQAFGNESLWAQMVLHDA